MAGSSEYPYLCFISDAKSANFAFAALWADYSKVLRRIQIISLHF